jgi:hypothetical protein
MDFETVLATPVPVTGKWVSREKGVQLAFCRNLGQSPHCRRQYPDTNALGFFRNYTSEFVSSKWSSKIPLIWARNMCWNVVFCANLCSSGCRIENFWMIFVLVVVGTGCHMPAPVWRPNSGVFGAENPYDTNSDIDLAVTAVESPRREITSFDRE